MALIPAHLDSNTAIELARFMLQKHYCDNDIESLVALFDNDISWFGAGEDEHAIGVDTVAEIFRRFERLVPKCRLSDEEYHAQQLSTGVWLCCCRMWLTTDPRTHMFLQVHQRASFVFRETPAGIRCSHIHVSNPYLEMSSGEMGFPIRMGRQSYEYLKKYMATQNLRMQAQNDELNSIYDTIPCAVVRLLRKDGEYQLLTYNQALVDIMGRTRTEVEQIQWSDSFMVDILPDDLPHYEAALASLNRPGDHAPLNLRVINKDKRLMHLSGNMTIISDDDKGQVIQLSLFDVSRRVELETLLNRLSFEDLLTGLYNRNRFIRDAAAYSSSPSPQLGVACLDINGLKATNDFKGHSAGDELLRRAARHLLMAFKGRAYRTGGDEFVVIEPCCDEVGFRARLEEVRMNLQRDGISAAIGMSWHAPGLHVMEQYDEADASMYQQKKQYYSMRAHDRRKG